MARSSTTDVGEQRAADAPQGWEPRLQSPPSSPGQHVSSAGPPALGHLLPSAPVASHVGFGIVYFIYIQVVAHGAGAEPSSAF